jgi:ABC-type amino acid transport substrate-binding protein
LSIAVSKKENNGLINIFRKIFSIQFMEVILLIFLILFIVGFLVWFFERKKNKDQFGDGLSNGLGSSFWWAAVTLTTVGYGDKVPKTIGGRTIAIIWMFAGLVMISSFTAAIASALTVDSLEINIDNLNDLYDVRVGTIGSTSSAEYLIQNDFSFITVGSIGEGLRFIQENRIDAFVYDAPILKYSIKKMNLYNEIELLPFVLDPINYAFAIPSSSLHLESINQNLLKEIDEADWKSIVKSYIGSY